MAKLQPLGNSFQIVDKDGRPTDYFIRWAQQRQEDIEGTGDDPPQDGKTYGKKDGAWVEIFVLPPGGLEGQLLAKASDAEGDYVWVDSCCEGGAGGFLSSDGELIAVDGEFIEA